MRIYQPRLRPYYIYAPDYTRKSTGISVLHLLCHTLNLSGREAYVTTDKTNSKFFTPLLTDQIRQQHNAAGLEPIVIYPEVTRGNPLNGQTVVRYILNHLGLLGGPSTYPVTDFLLGYTKLLQEKYKAPLSLYIPPTNSEIFNNENNLDDTSRAGKLLYIGRHQSALAERPDLVAGCTKITHQWPTTHEELAHLFRSSEVLYTFEASNVVLEAGLCGCPSIILQSKFFDGTPLGHGEFGGDGIALEDTEQDLLRARATVKNVSKTFALQESLFWKNLDIFVEQTQNLPVVPLSENDDNALRFTDTNYRAWLKRTSLQEIDGQLLAERMMKQWKKRPRFNIVIEGRPGEENLLADSIDSIATQWYPDWHLTLITDFPPADPSLAELEQITWVIRQESQDSKALFDSTLKQTPGDWLFVMEPGNLIEPHTLAYLADSINFAPQAKLIYCDEDVRNEAGEQAAPRFKPDANLELLRNMYYFGPALAVERQTLAEAGGWSRHADAALYDIALRILDHSGIGSIVHQRDMLLHTPEKCLRPIDAEAEQACLHEHLARQQVTAKVEAGFLAGTQKLTYPPQGSPLVSIIIPTRDQPGYLSHCIDSLARQTLYPNWELILVDHDSQDPDALNYLSDLNDCPPFVQRIEVTRTGGEFNYARLCNLGASLASGDYFLFLDNDTEIIQPSWLGDLLGQLQQPGVAAVSPRLSKPDGKFSLVQSGPRALGVGGLAIGGAGGETSLIEPGYCGRLQVAQDASALTGSCFMVSASAFKQAGGFNETDTAVFESVLELCLKFSKAGHRLIWTPWVDVVHHDGITRKRLENDVLKRAHMTEQILAERDYFYKNYLTELADDPYYHRHLSLNAPYAVEPHAVIDWDTRFHDRLRVLGQPLTSGSGEYRMVAPFRALQKAGLAQANIVHPIGHKLQRVLTPIELARAAPDVLMLQQAIDDTQINQLKRYRQFSPDIFVTYAVDDVLGNLPRKHYLYNFQAREGKSRMREGLAHCDRLIASTEPIADYCRDMIGDIVVVPNRLEGNLWQGLSSQRGVGKKPRVGWAGAQQHLGDLELIREVVESLANEVEWVFMGMCPDFLKPYVAEEHAFVPFKDYPAKLASLNLDLAIAPLEQHLFNEGKSNLRLLEYGIMGWPVICTDIYPYQTNNAPVKRLPNEAKRWVEAIRERIHDLDAAYKEGDALQAWVLKHYILEDHMHDWLEAVRPTR